MSGGGAAGAAAGAAAAVVGRAIKASGAIVSVARSDFLTIVSRQEKPLVLHAVGVFLRTHRYLCSYRGLVFFTKSAQPLSLPAECEVMEAEKIWIPG